MKASDNPYPSVLLEESAAPAAPAAGYQRMFVDTADHTPKRIDHSGIVSAFGGGGGGFPSSPPHTYVSGDLGDPASYWGASSVHIFSWTAPKTGWIAIYAGWQTTDLFNPETFVWAGNVANTDYPDRTAASGAFSTQPLARASFDGAPVLLHVTAGQIYTIAMTTFEDDTGKAITTQEWANAVAIFDGVGQLPDYDRVGTLDLHMSTDVGAPFTNFYVPIRRGGPGNRTPSHHHSFVIPKTPSGAASWSAGVSWYYKGNTDTNGDASFLDPRADPEWFLVEAFLRVTNMDDGSWAEWGAFPLEANIPTPSTGPIDMFKTATGGYGTDGGAGATGVTVPNLANGVFGFVGTHTYVVELMGQAKRRNAAHPYDLQNMGIYR